MTNPLLNYSSFWNSEFYEYLKEIHDDILIYYYPRLGTFLKDIFISIESKEKEDTTNPLQKIIFQPFYFDNFENLDFQEGRNLNKPTILYIIPPDIKILAAVAKNVQTNEEYSDNSDKNSKSHSTSQNKVIFYPRKTEECISWLNDHNSQKGNLFFDKNFVEFDFIPIDEKIFLIPFVDFFYKVFEKKDYSLLQICSEILTKIQFFYGKIPNVRIHGQKSKKIFDMFLEASSKISIDKFPKDRLFDNLIIIDRTTDLLTPVIPQLSYDGYIEEAFTLENGMISIPNDDQLSSTEHPITHQIFSKIRYLKSKEASTNKEQEIDKKNSTQTTNHEFEIKNYIHDYLKYRMLQYDIKYLNSILKNAKIHRSNIRNSNSDIHQNFSINGKNFDNSDLNLIEKSAESLLKLVQNASNRINEYEAYKNLREQIRNGLQLNFDEFTKSIQTFLYAEENVLFATQLIMSWCLINGDIPREIFDQFCDEIEFRYGSQASEQLHYLEKIQLITPNRTKSTFLQLNKVFKLEEDENINQQEHQFFSVDLSNKLKQNSYDGYSGYVPLSVRIIQEDLETIPGSITKRSDDVDSNNESNQNSSKRKLAINRNGRKLSYNNVLSSTVGSAFINFSDYKPKGMKLLESYFSHQYFYQNDDYVKSDEEVKNVSPLKDKKNENTLVFFVGGVTQLELAWLNWLTEKHFNDHSTIFVLSTAMLTADRFIKECLPCLREDHPSLKTMTDNAISLFANHHY
ncbi:Vacuolar protein sorting-associated protein 33A [Tritrichomonas musculus]|uniref:Vacuolar protein sorting-associated protein 33A n=1 Tax=Tritrichomonas musculus TaxID=1915356 RepID=A0ABR2JLM2_9EUKA